MNIHMFMNTYKYAHTFIYTSTFIWKGDVESLKESTAKAIQDAHTAQQRLHQISLSLELEVGRLGTQNKDLKEGFNQMRDQVRMEQLALENSNTFNRRLQEHLDAHKNERYLL
jgi:fructose/tagatose bisphosphate aldolase